jgi:hypothetical protein
VGEIASSAARSHRDVARSAISPESSRDGSPPLGQLRANRRYNRMHSNLPSALARGVHWGKVKYYKHT